MKPRTTQTCGDKVPAEDTSLTGAEQSELQRQGAKAAARGEPEAVNPMHESRNKPAATGESTDKWSRRSDAWGLGHRAQSATQRDDKLLDRGPGEPQP